MSDMDDFFAFKMTSGDSDSGSGSGGGGCGGCLMWILIAYGILDLLVEIFD